MFDALCKEPIEQRARKRAFSCLLRALDKVDWRVPIGQLWKIGGWKGWDDS